MFHVYKFTQDEDTDVDFHGFQDERMFPRRLCFVTLGGDPNDTDTWTDHQVEASRKFLLGPGFRQARELIRRQWPAEASLQNWGCDQWTGKYAEDLL
jgi:hypothetical protein